MSNGGDVIALVKPQFEAGKGKVGKKGVVREHSVHFEVLKKIADASFEEGFSLRGMLHFHQLPVEKEILNFYFI